MHFLLRDSDSQGNVSPHSVIVPNRRVASPTPGSSTLMTSAPNSASCVAANGPARNDATSSTRQPCKAWTSNISRRDLTRPLDDGIIDELAIQLDRGETFGL